MTAHRGQGRNAPMLSMRRPVIHETRALIDASRVSRVAIDAAASNA